MRAIRHGSTDQSVVIRIVDSADGTPEEAVEHDSGGIALWYRREGGTKQTITPAALSALNDAHSDGGIEHVDDGYYRLDVPDAAFASGAVGVMIGGTVTGMVVIGAYVPLVAVNPQDTVRFGLTALPNAAADAAGGLPISDAGGLDLDAQRTDVAAILVDTGTTLQNELDGIQADTEDIQSRLPAALVSGRMDSSVGAMAAGVVTAAAIATGAVDADALAADAVTEIQSGLATAAAVADLPTNAELATALADLPTAAENADAVWEEALADHEGTVGSTAEALADAGGSGASAADIADAVWDEARAGHTTAGTFGQGVASVQGNVTGSVGSVTGAVGSVTGNVGGSVASVTAGVTLAASAVQAIWDALTSALTTVGSIGKLIVDNLDAAISSRLASASYTAPPSAASIADAVLDENITQHGGANSVGAALGTLSGISNNVSSLQTDLGTVDTVVDAIKLKTDLIPASPATAGAQTTAQTSLTDLQGRVPAALTADGNIKADALAVGGSTTAATRLKDHALGVLKAVCAAGGSTTSVVLNAATGINGGVPDATNDHYNGRVIVFITGALAGQATAITDYVGATQTLTVVAMTEAPSAGDEAVIV